MVGSDHPWRQPRCMDWYNLESEITNPKGEFGYKEDFNELKELYEWINEFEPIKNRRTNNFIRSDEYLLRPLVNHVNKGRIWADDIGERVNLAYEKELRLIFYICTSKMEIQVRIEIISLSRLLKKIPLIFGLFIMSPDYIGESMALIYRHWNVS